MRIIGHELRQGAAAFALWTGAIALLLVVCVCIFPEMRGEADVLGALFASMGGFTAAFGLDRLNIGSLSGFYAVECGSILALGGGMFAALLGASALAKEERDGTAEFLLTHPVSRARVVTGKLAAALAQVAAMNAVLLGLSLAAVAWIGEPVPWKDMLRLHAACLLLQVELACAGFGLSAFLRRAAAGAGMGLAAMLYLLNLVANLTEKASFLKAVNPFAYCEGADILSRGALDGGRVAVGMLIACAAVAAAYGRYLRKDIR